MSNADRGGQTLVTGKIGKVRCLRQQIMMPGERMNMRMKGSIRLEALRERDAMRINAHVATFMTPLRWLWPEYPDYCKQGPDTAISPAVVANDTNWSALGIGAYNSGGLSSYYEFWRDAYLRCVNEWYKWPENNDYVAADIGDDGVKAVPLSKLWSRLRYDAKPDATADYTVSSATDFDVRDLAEIQGKFRSAMKRDVMSFNRWMEYVRQTWKGDGSREVDKVPIMLSQADVGVNPREMPAMDGASLGQWQSLFDFNVDHSIRGILAPEHCIITTLLTVRFASTIESCHPLAVNTADWHELSADPEYLATAKPVAVEQQDFMQGGTATTFGYAGAGWRWKSDHDVIGKRIDVRNSFPYMELPTSQAECKDASRVKPAFRSIALGDFLCDIYFTENCQQPIGDAMDSYFSGMLNETSPFPGGRNDEFPHGGKQL